VLGRQLGERGIHRVAVTYKKRKQLGQLLGRHVIAISRSGRTSARGSRCRTGDYMNALITAVAEPGQSGRPHRFHAGGQRAHHRHRVNAQDLGVLLLPGVIKWHGQNGIRVHVLLLLRVIVYYCVLLLVLLL